MGSPRKWPYLLLLLGACSQGDEHPPMIGDCQNCPHGPVSAGGSSGFTDATVDVNNAGDVANPEVLANDIGVANLDSPFPF